MNYRYLLPGTTVYPGGSAVYGAGSAFSNTSYTVRGFAPNVISLPITPIDEQYHSKQYFMEQDPIDLSWSYRNTFPYGATATNVPNIIQEQWVGTAEIGGGPAPYLDFQTQTTLSGSGIYGIQYTQTLLDTLPQYVGSNVGDLGPGNGWLGGDISQDGKHIYGVSVPFGGSGVTISVFSDSRSYDLRGLRNETRSDNLLAPWGISSATPGYYFQMGVWEFPGSSAVSPGSCSIQFIDANANSLAVALNGTSLVYNGTASNAASSWITYPSGTAATGGTSTFATGSGTAAGYGMTVRIDAASVNAYIDLTKLQQVGFNLGSADTKYALNVSNLKLIKSTYGEFGAGVQTKLGYFQGEFWPQVTQSSFPPIYQDTFLAKDYTYVVRFNSGSLPASANAFSVYARINPDRVGSTNDYLHIKVQSDSSSTQMFGYDGGASGTARPQLFNEIGPVLAEKTDYVFLLYLNGSKVNAEIRSLSAASLGGNYSFQTDIYSTYANTSGYVGYSLVPQTGNFYVDYMYAKDVILAQYTSENFNSSLPVTGVSLYTNTSAPNNIITYANGTAVNFYPEDSITLDNLWAQAPDSSETAGYATASPDYLFLPPQITTPSIKITKNIVYANIGGVRYYTPFTANRSRAISVQGKLYYQGALDLTRQSSINPSIDQKKGVFRVVLWDKYFRKTLFVSDILQLTPNSWNDFEVDINTDIYDNELQLEIQHVGTVENTTLGTTNPTASFWLNDIKVLYRGIEWEASNNNGLSWVPFYDNVNQPYAGVHFSNDVYSYLVNGDNAVVYWQFDELSGTAILNFATSTGAANNAHYSSGTSLLSYNTSLSGHTDPLNDGVRIAGSTSPATAILTSPVWPGIPSGVSAEAWIRAGTALPQLIVGQNTTSVGSWKLFVGGSAPNSGGGTVGFQVITSLGTQSALGTVPYFTDTEATLFSPATANWINLVGTFNGNEIELYYGGTILSRNYSATTTSINTISPILSVGPTSGYRYQDETAIYPEALDNSQVIRHYNSVYQAYNNLKIRAKAYTQSSWIKNYEVTPHYARPGRFVPPPIPAIVPVPAVIYANEIVTQEKFANPTVTYFSGFLINELPIASKETWPKPQINTIVEGPGTAFYIPSKQSVPAPTVTLGAAPGGGGGANNPTGVGGLWYQVFNDSFSGNSLDTTKWNSSWFGGGSMNGVTTSPANVTVSGGNLALQLSSSSVGALINTNPSDSGLSPGFQLTYGYTEARIYFPGSGATIYNWPAFWTDGQSWPDTGEIDIAEGLGGLTANYHGGPGDSGISNGPDPQPGTWSNGWHVYGVDREPGQIKIYWDGVLIRTVSTADNGALQYLIFNVGSGSNNVTGSPGAMLVDYVTSWVSQLTSPTFSVTPGNGSLTINAFGAISNAVSYSAQLYQSDGVTAVGGPVTVTTSGYTFSSLSGNTTYKVGLTAVGNNAYGASIQANVKPYANSAQTQVSGTTTGSQLTTPSFTVTAGNTTIVLNAFSAVPNASSYTAWVYDATNTTLIQGPTTVTITGTTFTGLTNGTTYTVRLQAIGDGVTYTNSAVATQSTTPSAGGGGGGVLYQPKSPVPSVLLISFENYGVSDIVGQSGAAPYINNTLLANFPYEEYWSVGHYSACNYVMMVSGINVHDANGAYQFGATNPNYNSTIVGDSQVNLDSIASGADRGIVGATIFDQLSAMGMKWTAYVQSSPAPASYRLPQNYFPHISSLSGATVNRDADSVAGNGAGGNLISDLNSGSPPQFMFYTPNNNYNGHDTNLTYSDTWLSTLIPNIQATTWYKNGGTIIIWWDEQDAYGGDSTTGLGGICVAIIVSLAAHNTVKPGLKGSSTGVFPSLEAGFYGSIQDTYGFPRTHDARFTATGNFGTALLPGTPAIDKPQFQWIMSAPFDSTSTTHKGTINDANHQMWNGSAQPAPKVFAMDYWQNGGPSQSNTITSAVHALPGTAIAVMNIGEYEAARADMASWTVSSPWVGTLTDPITGNHYIDIRTSGGYYTSTIKPLMQARFSNAKNAGFDMVGGYGMDAYINGGGFSITAAQEAAYIQDCVTYCHSIGIGFAQMNAFELGSALAPVCDAAITENGWYSGKIYGGTIGAYLRQGKPIWNVEYTGNMSRATFNSFAGSSVPTGIQTYYMAAARDGSYYVTTR